MLPLILIYYYRFQNCSWCVYYVGYYPPDGKIRKRININNCEFRRFWYQHYLVETFIETPHQHFSIEHCYNYLPIYVADTSVYDQNVAAKDTCTFHIDLF